MYEYYYKIIIGQHPVYYGLRFRETSEFFGSVQELDSSPAKYLYVTKELYRRWRVPPGKISPQAEFDVLLEPTADYMLQFDWCFFHAVAVAWRGKAFLITAPSGTGKSTQFVNWKKMFPEEISIINGDKPLLEFKEKNQIIVHPSPWRGKEGWGEELSLPLAGIVCLKQGNDNRIFEVSQKEVTSFLFSQFIWSFHVMDQKKMNRISEMEAEIFQSCKIWMFVNRGDDDSTKMMRDVLGRSLF